MLFTEQGRPLFVQPPNLKGQVFVFMSPSERVVQLRPQAQSFLFVAFYDSRSYGGGILTRHMITIRHGRGVASRFVF
jgi:hypothetical protein